MGLLQYNSKEKDLLARLMRAEAIGEGELGMLMVGNVIINRAISKCLTFQNVSTINDVIYQNPGGFSGVNSPLFFSNPTTKEQQLAQRVIDGNYFHPATHALWFYAPGAGKSCSSTWWDQELSGKYKNHCFYRPESGVCPQLY